MIALDTLPYYRFVPKDVYANLMFRRHILATCAESEDARREQWMACARDILYYVNVFCWTYNPKLPEGENFVLPFITYPYQDVAFVETHNAIGHHDLLFEKTRDMGASWILITTFEWFWHFKPMQSFLIGSRKEDLVDKTDDPDSLFWKFDYLHKCQPKWLVPTISPTHLNRFNKDNGSTFAGESTNDDFGRGGRKTAIGLDEHAHVENAKLLESATRDATNCRIYNSTPNGINTEFYRKRQGTIRKLRFHWTHHPTKAKGIYVGKDGKPHSPWYDYECERADDPLEIARELDIDYGASESLFFPSKMIADTIAACCGEPLFVGEMDYETDLLEPLGVMEEETGRLSLWVKPDKNGKIKDASDYALGVDVAAVGGSKSSQSVISIGQKSTGNKIGEFVTNQLYPGDLARMAIVISRWLAPKHDPTDAAFIIWEANGPGREFGDTLIELGHRNYYRKEANTKSQEGKITEIPGWWSSTAEKLLLLSIYRSALKEGKFFNPSRSALEQCYEFVRGDKNKVFHRQSKRKDNPATEDDNHGDQVIADALLCYVMDGTTQQKEEKKKKAPYTSLFAKRERANARKRQSETESWAV